MDSTENFGSGLGLYLYCLYAGGNSLPVRGLTASVLAQAGTQTGLPVAGTQTGIPDLVGIDGEHKVFALSKGDVHAALSLVPLREFGASRLAKVAADLEWISARVLVHERIIEEIMAVYPVMPVRFCTIFAAKDKLEELIEVHREKISRFLSDMADKEEWGVKGYLKAERLEEALKNEYRGAEVVAVKQREASPGKGRLPGRLPVASTQTGGQAYLLQKKNALAVKDRLDGAVARIAEEVFQGLLDHAVDGVRTKALRLESGEETGELVLNAALLVPKSDVKSFLGCVKDREKRHRSHGLSLSVSGPWPPYNFCPLLDEIVQQ